MMKTHELRYKLPEILFGSSEIVYKPRSGLDIALQGTEGPYSDQLMRNLKYKV